MTPEDRLDSWKEIAAYLQRDVTTVQRWEKREGMPVRRHLHDKLGSVYAFRSELDAWAAGRNPVAADAASSSEAEAEAATAEAPRSTPRARRPSVIAWTVAAGALLVAIALVPWLLRRTDYFWRNPLEGARLQKVTDFGGSEQAAAVSRDGRFVAFLSDREGHTNVWVTQVGTGQFYDLTRGLFPEIVNPSIRALGFSPDGALVTFWARGAKGTGDREIGIWAIPVLGGAPRPYLEGAAEFDWSRDGRRVAYHTPGPGDPMFVRDADEPAPGRALFTAASGLHAHFPLWSADGRFVYFVQGSLPEAMDVWRIPSKGGPPERITQHATQVTHPVLLDDRTLLYLAGDRDGSGPGLYAIDVERRVARRISAGLDRYTSLAASADGRRLVATLANPKGSLWRMSIAEAPEAAAAATPITLRTGRGFSPRLGPGYLLYVSSKGAGDGIWKLADGASTELWSVPEAHVIGGPEIARDGRRVTFSIERRGRRVLYVMNADGTEARVVTDALDLRGAPAWSPDGASILSAVQVDGGPQLFRISLEGAASPLLREYALDPVWSPGGDLLVYSGADVGTTFPVKALGPAGEPRVIAPLTLTRGSRRFRFLPGRRTLVALRGEIEHKDLWLFDLDTGVERRLTRLPPDFDVRDFDVSPDAREVVLERVEEHSDIVLIDLAPHD